MTSEIRANKQTNRVGLGTVTYTDTGIIVSGIVTANSLGGIGHINVGSNIQLGNAGIVTATKIVVGTGVTIEANQVATGQATFTGIVTASAFKLSDGSAVGGVTSDARYNTVGGTDVATNRTSNSYNNTLFGYQAGKSIFHSDSNVAIGHRALRDLSSGGNYNVAVGEGSGIQSLNASYCAFVGNYSGSNCHGEWNVALGYQTLSGGSTQVTGDKNTALGGRALYNVSSGDNNVGIGYGVGYGNNGDVQLITGSNNILIGFEAAPSNTNVSNEITLGNSSINHLRIPGIGVSFSEGGGVVTGIITATSFSGSGANLTSLPAQATIANNADNRVITGGSGVNLNGEANLTFDGSNVIHAGSDGRRYSFAGDGSSHYMKFDSTLNGIKLNGYGGIAFETNGTNERLRITSGGDIEVKGESSSSPYPIRKLKWSNDGTTTSGFYIAQHSDRNGRIWHEQGLDLHFGTTNIERLRISHNGNVTFGEGSAAGINGQRIISFKNLDQTSSSTAHTIEQHFNFNRSGGGMDLSAARIVAGKEQEWVGAASNQDGFLDFYTAYNETPARRIRIQSTGRMLINPNLSGLPGNTPNGGGEANTNGFLNLRAANGECALGLLNSTSITNNSARGTVLTGINFINYNYYTSAGRAGTGYVIRNEKGHSSYMDRCDLRLIPGYNGNTLYSNRSVVFEFDGAVRPGSNDYASLGTSGAKWTAVFAVNGSIQTSDENLKQNIQSLSTAEMKAAASISKLFITYKWKSKVAKEEAGGDAARIHTGVIAQRIKAALEAEGLTAANYSFWCENITWRDSEGNIAGDGRKTGVGVYDELTDTTPSTDGYTKSVEYAVRYDELLSFVAAYNEQRFTSIESRLTALEGS